MKNKLLLIIVLLGSLSFTQEKERWGKNENPYIMKKVIPETSEYKFSGDNAGSILINSFVSLYWFFISDQDGDRCPFHPTCSHFFLESVKKTDLFQGSMMTADRLTRDMNIFGRRIKYKYINNNRFFDPPELYTLNKIHYPPVE